VGKIQLAEAFWQQEVVGRIRPAAALREHWPRGQSFATPEQWWQRRPSVLGTAALVRRP